MSLFDRLGKKSTDASKEVKKNNKEDIKKGEKIVIKRTRVGFRLPKKEPEQKESNLKNKMENKTPQIKDNLQLEDAEREIFQDDIPENINEPEKQWTTSPKKKNLLLGDMKGKPVYLEDTGEQLGTVFDMMYDTKKNLIGYKIKDKKN